MFLFILSSAQCIVVSVTSYVMYGAALKMEQKSPIYTAWMYINPEHSAPVTRDDAAVNGRVASGAR